MQAQSCQKHAPRSCPDHLWSEPAILAVGDVDEKDLVWTICENDASIITEGCRIELQGEAALFDTLALTLRLPFDLDDKQMLWGHLLDVRGHAFVSPGARARLTIQLAGTTHSIGWPLSNPLDGAAEPFNQDFIETVMAPERTFSREMHPARPEPLPCTIQLLLTAERRDKEAGVTLTVDSLDLRALLG